MLGKEFDTRVKPLPELGDVVLGASNIRPNRQVQPFSLEVRRGEIVGLVGLAGSGALEIAAALAGGKALVQGSLTVNNKTVPINNRCAAVKAGVGFVPADRNAEGLFSLLPAMTNASASMLHITSLWGWIRKGAESKLFTPWAKRLQLNPPSLDLHAGGFSGGNQQKILLFRNLALNGLSVLVVAEPTRGVDIGAREMIHEAIVEAAKNGVAVIMASSDLDEVLQLSHRILVITGGRLTATLPRDAKSEELMSCLAESAAEGTP
jgi:ABC-type sugar transport system ATPase subunit